MTSELRCSRAGCHCAATWNVNWRNPAIHPDDRVKVWLACDEHRAYLRDYLASRGFPVAVEKCEAALHVTALGDTALGGTAESAS